MITADDAIRALEDVHDAHVPVSLRRMGMLDDVRVDSDGGVEVRICIPCMACPAASFLSSRIEDVLLALDGVTRVDVDEGWHLSWDRDSVDAEARSLMRTNGIQL
ncbi:MAG: metal-sulfur cluster assembly factor [Streptosporangiales bacterium]